MTFEIANGLSAQALYENIEIAARQGYTVDSGCDVSINTGTLGQTDTLSVASGQIQFAGDTVSVSSQNVKIDASDPDQPRKDVVYLDGTGTKQVAKGTPAEPTQEQKDLGAERFEFYQPTPLALDATDAVVLAEVWVDDGSTSLSSVDLGDRRAFTGASSGGGYNTVTPVTSNYTASTNELVLVDASAGAVTVTQPSPEEGKPVGVEKTDTSSNTVTISPNGNENVNYGSSEDLAAQGESVDLVSDGTDWYVV